MIEMKPSQIVVKRNDGGRPLRFEGRLISQAEDARGTDRHEVRVYLTRGGRIVVAHTHHLPWEGPFLQARVVPSAEWVPTVLADFGAPPRIRSEIFEQLGLFEDVD
ncbi:MAG: hypothetical protein RMI00_06550 [Sulfolobales archaeon]|nr:hypothetical protein [Sulfolobales archaeon]